MKSGYNQILLLFSMLILQSSFGQTKTKGIVVSHKDIASYVQVYNKTKNIRTTTNEEGRFKISTEINDTLVFLSTLYEKKNLIVNPKIKSKKLLIIKLKEKTNLLDEIILEKKWTFSQRDLDTINAQMKTLAIRDRKNKPWEYKKKDEYLKPTGSSIDFGAVFQMISKLFKKNKKIDTKNETWRYEDFLNMFEKNEILTSSFLEKDLKIPSERINAFFYYLQDKHIAIKKPVSQAAIFEITEKIIIAAQEFNNL